MAQAGIHGFVGLLIAQRMPNRKWLRLGFVLGNALPDADILAAGPAVLLGLSADDVHRTFSHSILAAAAAIAAVCCLAGRFRSSRDLMHLGVGLGLGMLVHMLIDFVLWFRGMQICWPIPWRPNLWRALGELPGWARKAELSAEFLCFAGFYVVLIVFARRRGTNGDYWSSLWLWTIVQAALFTVSLPLVAISGVTAEHFRVFWWLAYIPSLAQMFYVIVRMQDTIETVAVT